MKKETLASVVLILLLVLTTFAQKNKSNQSDQQSTQTPQVSLEQRLSELSKEISDELTGNQKTTVAIADFVDLDGKSSNFGKFLAEELVTRLYKTKKLKVIERQRLDKVIAEQKLSLSDIIESSSAKKIGRVLGVDAIVAGTISELSSNFKINARIISTETGELLAAAGATVAKDQEVCSLINCSSQTGGPRSVSEGFTRGDSDSPAPKTWKVDSNFFTFDLQKCQLSGASILCEFIIINNDTDRRVTIDSYYSRLFDDFGNEYKGNEVKIANVGREANLISKVPVKARITFEGASSEATKITKLLIKVWAGEGRNNFIIEYQNIPLR